MLNHFFGDQRSCFWLRFFPHLSRPKSWFFCADQVAIETKTLASTHIYGEFPKIGVPLVIIQVHRMFSIINHLLVPPRLWKPIFCWCFCRFEVTPRFSLVKTSRLEPRRSNTGETPSFSRGEAWHGTHLRLSHIWEFPYMGVPGTPFHHPS